MQNVEFKSELRDLSAARTQCRVLGAALIGRIRQSDTYFRLPDGRLKRRESPGEPVEWIFYHRENRSRPRLSSFTILSDAQATLRWGTHGLKPWLVVSKWRELWMKENVRIHLDEVDGLGTFIEFEALVSGNHDAKECRMMVQHLRETFAPILGEAVGTSYSDLAAGV